MPLLVGIASFIVYRRKINRAHQELTRARLLASERDRIARDLHDDLGTDLSTILFLSDDVTDNDDPDRAEIAKLSKTALSKMRDIVWTLSDEGVGLQQLIDKVLIHFNDQCQLHYIEFSPRIKLPISILSYQLSRGYSTELPLILREALENAIRHGKPSEIQLHIRSETSDAIQLSVIDNGIGFDPSKVNGGLGLSNLRLRSTRLGGHLSIESKTGKGTSINFQVVIQKA